MSNMKRIPPFLTAGASAFGAFNNIFKKYFLPMLSPKVINANVKTARMARKNSKALKHQQHKDAVNKAHYMRIERNKAISDAMKLL
uniref:Uncharacterized protein n=1 Tax=viral metagenome TaxID=1070528 RepID=A0A6M3KBS5_9ZZZZ